MLSVDFSYTDCLVDFIGCMFPKDFLERLQHIVPEDKYDQILEAMTLPGATSFRVNTLIANTADILVQLIDEGLELNEVPWYSDAYWVSHKHRDLLLTSTPFRNQQIYVQNQSSMIPPLVLSPQPGERILDLTAAPGSKTLQMACMVNQQAEIAAVEVVRGRFFKLRDNLKAQGATEVRTFLKDGRSVWKNRPEYFDRVLLDAPCSSEGRFHLSNPETYAYWSPRKIKEMVRKQRRLLYSGIQSLKPGGTLVYSTCSFAPEENEAILNGAIQKFKEKLEVQPVELSLENVSQGLTAWQKKTYDPAVMHGIRILPSYLTDGFFVCKLIKKSSTLEQK